MRFVELLILAAGTALAGSCLLVAPLDDLNHSTGSSDASDVGVSGAGGSKADAADGAAECTTNAQCIALNADEPYRCLDGKCIKLKTPGCPVVRGRPEHPNAIFIAGFSNINPQAPGFEDITWNYDLALKEFNSAAVVGLPGPGGTHRPLAMVICKRGDAGADLALQRKEVFENMSHVVDTVRVPAVLAPIDSGLLLEAYDLYGPAGQRNVFFLTPAGATPAHLKEGNEQLWHMLGQPADLAPTYAELLPKYEAYVKQRRMVTGDIRVTTVYTDEAFDSELERAARGLLKFNGKSLAENGGLGLYQGISLQSNAPLDDIKTAARSIIDFKPHIVISMAGPVFAGARMLLYQIELDWPAPADAERPHYILSPTNFAQADDEVLGNIKSLLFETLKETDAHKRFIGIGVAGSEDSTLLNEYVKRLHDVDGRASSQSENVYDAVYFLAYAISAAGALDKIVGSDIAPGMHRLITGGKELSVGPDDILAVFDELGKPNGTISLQGTLGPPRFNRQYGVRIDTGALYCFEKLPFDNLAVHFQVGYYDPLASQDPLRVSKRFAGRPLPCLQDLILRQP